MLLMGKIYSICSILTPKSLNLIVVEIVNNHSRKTIETMNSNCI